MVFYGWRRDSVFGCCNYQKCLPVDRNNFTNFILKFSLPASHSKFSRTLLLILNLEENFKAILKIYCLAILPPKRTFILHRRENNHTECFKNYFDEWAAKDWLQDGRLRFLCYQHLRLCSNSPADYSFKHFNLGIFKAIFLLFF